jgi:hypothetical protein
MVFMHLLYKQTDLVPIMLQPTCSKKEQGNKYKQKRTWNQIKFTTVMSMDYTGMAYQ